MGEKKRCGDDVDLPLLLLPEDFLIQILVFLPVQSLLRFKSVCKSWRELIESSFFIDLHTTTTFNSSSSSSSKFDAFILQTVEHSYEYEYEYVYDGKIIMSMLSSSASGDTGEDDDEDDDDQKKMVFKVDDLGFLPFYKDYLLTGTSRMVGSCNGIICLHDPMLMDHDQGGRKHHYLNLRDVYLWNPATRQFRILPKSIPIKEKKIYMGNTLEDFVAFGFDVKTKDYKVLRITPWDHESEEGGCMCRVQVYSLSTDSWRLLDGINYLPVVLDQGMLPNHGIYLNGRYFFVGGKFIFRTNVDWMMLSFDFTKEIFTTMQLPDDKCSTHIFELVLSYLGEKLVVFITTLPIDFWVLNEQHGSHIWVLNEQHGSGGVSKESWTKLHICLEETYTEPIRISSYNGEFASISKEMQLFNLVTKEAKKDFLIGTTKCRADVYKESLVSIMGGGNVLLRWQLPTHGTCYKLYLDAPFINSYRPFGIGLCLTSDTGGCIGVRSLKIRVRDAEQGEALAMLEAIKWAKELELSPIVLESDSEKCLSFLMDDDDCNLTNWSSEALSLLREAKLLLNSSELGSSISFQYCSRRSCNYVADIAAKLGRESLGVWACKDWSANSPGEMVRSLSKDLGIETRQGGEFGWQGL